MDTVPLTPAPLFTQPLPVFGQNDLAVAGGKGAHLGELVRAGFSVPPGFVVMTTAYDHFVAHNQLREVIAGAHTEATRGLTVRAAFEAAPIPPEVEQAVVVAYQQLGAGPVAVRSSATAEDLPGATFAGQQDTYLNIVDTAALLVAVRRCWASLWTDRAIAYREHQAVNPTTLKLAVVVQRLIPAEIAGVMFTANPVTGAREELVVDASPGLGEALVSGLVTPDHFVLDRRSGRVKEQRLGRREVIIRAKPAGGIEQVTGTPTEQPLFPAPVLKQLARLGVAIEQHFGPPQDIEWAWAGGALFVLQARPMTALPTPLPPPSRIAQMLAPIYAEMFPVRPYPLDQTTWFHTLSSAAVEPLFELMGLRATSVDQMFIEADGVIEQFSGQIAVRPTPALLIAPLRVLWFALRYDPLHAATDPVLAAAQARVRILEAQDLGASAWEQLLTLVREALALPLPLAGEQRRRYLPRAALAAGVLQAWLVGLGQGHQLNALLTGAESLTLKANRALEALAARVRADPALADLFAHQAATDLWVTLAEHPAGQAFLVELQSFLAQYGHRETVLSTALQPTWGEAPELVLGMVKGLALTEPRSVPHPAEWEVARAAVLAHPLLRLPLLRAAFLNLLSAARCIWPLRENTHFNLTLVLPVLRRILLEFGHRLVGVGVLEAPAEVFHLKFAELEQVGGRWPPSPELANTLRGNCLRRKERRALLAGKPVVDPRFYQPPAPEGAALLRGTPGSPGIAAGPVRVIRDSAEFDQLQIGEVLVAPFTNPAWTPLFQRASAVVVDGGSAASHAAIVAREYGIPAVMGTITGTQRLVNGQRVQVDGTQGVIWPAP